MARNEQVFFIIFVAFVFSSCMIGFIHILKWIF